MRIKRFLNELTIFDNRASCSQNEQRAAKHIFELMGMLKLKTQMDEFKSQKSMTGELVLILSLFLIGIVSSFYVLALTIPLSLIGLILFWGYFTNRFKPLASIFRHSISTNVIGKLANEAATYKVIISAHHDTARSSLLWHPQLVANFRSSFVTGVVVLIFLQILLLLKTFGISSLILNILIIAAGDGTTIHLPFRYSLRYRTEL